MSRPSDTRAKLRALLEDLPREDLLIVLLYYADDLDAAGIAEVLGVDAFEICRRYESIIRSIREAIS